MTEPEYRVKANGTVVMTFDVFRAMSHAELCRKLGLRTL